MNGNHGDSVWAQAGLTARRTCRADAKAEPSEPTLGIRCWGRLSDKSYSRDNRLVPPKSSYRRRSSAPRCRLTTSWGWRSSQRFGCSPIKVVRELGSDRQAFKYADVMTIEDIRMKSKSSDVTKNMCEVTLIAN